MSSYKVLVSDKLAPEGLALLEAAEGIEVDVKPGLAPEDLLGIIAQYDGLAIRSGTKVTAQVIEAARKLKVVGRAGIGVDNVDLSAATKRGILVMNTPEGNVVTTAEHAISLMCSLTRNIPKATASVKAGRWEKSKLQGRELFGKTLGVVGLGNIGKIVASRGLGLQMKVVAFDPFVTKARAQQLGVELLELDALLASADYVTLHVPLTDKTRGLIGEAALSKMKRGAFLINAARGGLVDERAVCASLDAGHLAGAAFDVYEKEPPDADHPLLQQPNVVLTPHLGASTSEAQVNVSVSVAQQIIDYLSGGVIKNAINAPAVSKDLLDQVGPYLHLASKLGRMAGQLHRGNVESVRIKLAGASTEMPAEIPTAPIRAALLVGLLETALGRDVNPVSANVMAEERGIEVSDERTTQVGDFRKALTVEVQGEGRTQITGTLFGADDARIVMVEDFRLEIVPKGYVLLTEHTDQPGIIGRIGTVLGDAGINIARLNLSKKSDTSEAHAALSIDARVSSEVLGKLQAIEGINSVEQLDLG